jgi:hypothetical protein
MKWLLIIRFFLLQTVWKNLCVLSVAVNKLDLFSVHRIKHDEVLNKINAFTLIQSKKRFMTI